MYTSFAQVYDRLMRGVDYAAWAAFYKDLLLEWGVAPGARVAECACGTGNLTIPLSETFAMTGIDLSEAMLEVAIPKAKAHGRDIRFVRQDMRRLALHRPADAVLCTCDGLNYLMTPRQTEEFYQSAYAALKPGGVLALDVSTPYKLEHVLGSNTLFKAEEDIAYIWQNEWEASRRRVHMQLDIFAREKDSYRRIVETQSQQAHSAQEITAGLEKAGFEQITLYGDMAREAGARDERMHLMARKPFTEET